MSTDTSEPRPKGEAPADIGSTAGAFATRSILGVDVVDARAEIVLDHLLQRVASGEKTAVVYANANFLTHSARDPELRRALGHMLVLNDGIAVDLACRILFGRKFSDNLNGTDFTPALLKALPKGTRVFLYGAREHVAAKMANEIEQEYRLQVCGWRDGYSGADALAEVINNARADVVLVALGNPLQERWIDANRSKVSAPLLVGVGAYFDFATQEVPRAPAMMRALRCEWLFRLMIEPRRLWRRYTVETFEFFRLVLKQARAQRT